MKSILPLLNLDDLTYEDLVEEARAQIPGLYPDWTDHNPSDPGIALIELLAWLTEMVNYRSNQVPDESYRVFLKLLRGPDAQKSQIRDLDKATRRSVLELWECYRAVTVEDYEQLVIRQWPQITIQKLLRLYFETDNHVDEILENAGIDKPVHLQSLDEERRAALCRSIETIRPKIKEILNQRFGLNREMVSAFLKTPHLEIRRASCIPQRNLTKAMDKEINAAPEPGQISIVVVHGGLKDPSLPIEALHAAVWAFLDERRLLATRHHVVGPEFLQIEIFANIALQKDTMKNAVRERADQALQNFFDPLTGGFNQTGWPFGRDIYVSEIYELLSRVPGIDFVGDIVLGTPNLKRWQYDIDRHPGTLIGIILYGNELPALKTFSTSFI